MTATPYQPVPTIAQRKVIHRDHVKRYEEYQRLRVEQPEPANFCAPDDVSPWSIRAEFGRMWPAWAIAFLIVCCASAALTVLVVGVL